MVLDFSQSGFNMIFDVTDDGITALKEFSKVSKNSDKKLKWCPVVEIHVSGENQDDHHGAKHTGTSASKSLRYCSHKYYENMLGNKLELELSDAKLAVTAHYQFYTDISAVRAWTVVKNISNANVGLEYVSSFSYTRLENDKPSYYNSS